MHRGWLVRGLVVAAVVVVGGGVAGVAGLLGGGAAAHVRRAPSGVPPAVVESAVPTSEGNRRLAVRDAERVLGLAVLPSGADRLYGQPSGGWGALVDPSPIGGLTVDRYGWWRSSDSFDAVLAFVRAHQPRGWKLSGSGEVDGGTDPDNESLVFTLPASGHAISSRQVIFAIVALKSGGTGIKVDAQDLLVRPRAASEKVPAGVREVDVHETEVKNPRSRPTSVLFRRVTGARSRRIVALIDRMPIAQSGAMSCGAVEIAPTFVVTFDFRAAPDQPALATAALAYAGYASGPCNPVGFTVRGKRRTPLIGGSFLMAVQHLLAVRFRYQRP